MKRPTGFLVAILTLALAGCATTLHSIPDDYQLGSGPESVVIGHVTIDMGAKPIEFFDKLDRISFEVESDSTGERYEIVCDEKGSDSDFFVALLPGQYTLSQVDKGNMTASPRGKFTVPGAQVAYFGTLKFKGAGVGAAIAASVLSGQSGVHGGWGVVDDYPAAVATFNSRYPQIKATVAKALFVVDR